jgi:acyl-CoA reductase-like NAD-dependent aldehyde dehydrogenase
MSDMRGVTGVNGAHELKHFVDDEWRGADGNRLFDVYRPYDRKLYARVAAGGRAEVARAVDAAAKAFPAWSQSTLAMRASLFFKAGGEPQ